MMDRNREARRAAAMTNGLPRRRHRTTTGGSLRESPEDESPMELQDTAARLRDRTVKKERDREIRDRDRDRDRDRERERLNRSKRRRGDKYMHGSNRDDGGGVGGVDDSSEDSVNDEDEEEDDGLVRYVPPSNPVPILSTSAASTLTSHRKSYPPPNKVIRVAPTWKAPDEMIGVSIPRKARSASTKRGHDCWSSAAGGHDVNNRQASASPVRSTMTAAVAAAAAVTIPSPSPVPFPVPPMSPSSSNVSIKKKIVNGGLKQRPPKSTTTKTCSPSIQDEIEIEVAEVLYGLMRQSQAPSKQDGMSNDSAKLDSRSIADSKSRVSSPAPNSPSIQSLPNNISSSSTPPLTTVAPKRKRPRPYPEEIPSGLGPRSSPISSTSKVDSDHAPKLEVVSPSTEKNAGSGIDSGVELVNSQDLPVEAAPSFSANNVIQSDAKQGLVEESAVGIRIGMMRAKVEEASSSPKLESPKNHDRVESTTTSTKPNSAMAEQDYHREDKYEIDLMAPPPQSRTSPEREEEMAKYGGDEKCMVTDKEAEAKPSTKLKEEEDEKKGKSRGGGGGCGESVEFNSIAADEGAAKVEPPKLQPPLNLNGKERERNIDLQLDFEKSNNVNEDKLNFQKQQQQQQAPPPKTTRDDANTDKHGGQLGSAPLPMSVPGGWHGGLAPMGYVGPMQGVVSMDGTPMASPPIQAAPHFLFTQPKPKRCATHCHIARSISVHNQMMKMNPFWPAAAAAAAAAGSAPLFGAKPYNLNMVPSADLHAAAAAGRGMLVNSTQDNKGQPFTFFPGQPASSSKDKSPHQTSNATDSAQKKQFLLQSALPPGAPSNLMHTPALFFPMGQQQAAVANARPSSTKSPSAGGSAASASASTSAPMGAVAANSNAGPAMSFSYPNIGGNEAQFMAILGNGAYPFPIPAHVGAAPPYRGSHPQAAMSFFNGPFYSSQMLHPSQLQQQQAAQPSQSMQIQQQNQPNASISTASSSSQKHLQNLQQQRPQGSNAPGACNPNQGLQNLQANKGRSTQPHHDVGGEDSPSTADSRNRPNMNVYGQNFAPFHSPNFGLMTPPSSLNCGSNAAGAPNGNHGDKKHQQPQQAPLFPMSFATISGATTPGLDMSSIAHNHALMQSLPEAARQNYIMAAAAQAAQAAQQKKNNYRGPEDGKPGAAAVTDPSNIDEERKAMAARAAASSGQSIAFSRDLAENAISTMPGNNVVDSSARSLNLMHGSSTRPSRSSGANSNSNPSHPQQHQQQQQQQQMIYSKQQQYVPTSASSGRSKTPTSNGNVYADHLTSSSIMAAKFPNSLSGFPHLAQTSGSPVQAPQWKNSGRPNTQVSTSAAATSTASNMKNLPQQQGRSQQNHTQISFGATPANPKTSSTSQGQQPHNNNQSPSSPMVVGSPSTSSVSKGASGSPRTTASASTGNKGGAQASALSSQQGKNSHSPSLTSQKQSILGSPHIMSTPTSASKPHQSQQQPQLSKQSIQQAQLFFSNAYMQASVNTSAAMAGSGYYIQRHRPDSHQQQQQQQQQHQQQQQQGFKSHGSGPPTSSSGMLSLCTPVSLANTSTSDPAKAVAAAAAAAAANGMKGGLPSQGMFHATAQFAAQSAGGTHQLMPAGFPYAHTVSSAVQVKPAEQKQPAGE